MEDGYTLAHFFAKFPDDNSCLEEIKKQRFPKGVYCTLCKRITKHYKLNKRPAYSCTICRNQVYPLQGTLFEKSSTSLQIWFFALFLLTHTRSNISTKQLQRELGVTYKTAWRIHKNVRMLMEQNDGDLLKEIVDKEKYKERRWVFFNKLEISWVEKKEAKE